MKKDKILIVDDATENIDILVSLLKEKYELIATKDGERAIQLACDNNPDLILLDIMMPIMDGFEVCKILKANDKTKDIPIIFLTAQSQIDYIVEGFKLGGVDYITKSFNPIELEARIDNHLELKKAREVLKIQNNQLNLINIQIHNSSKESEDKVDYLADRIKRILSEKHVINDQLSTVKCLLPLIAINDLGSLKVVSKILEESTDSIDELIKDPTEEYFKILTYAVEPLKTAIANIESVIESMISIGLIDKDTLNEHDISKSSFNKLLLDIYMQGKLSSEHYEDFIELAKYNVKKEEDNFTLF